MIKVFKFVKTVTMNIETNEVLNITETVETENGTSQIATARVKKPIKSKLEEGDRVLIDNNKLILTKSVIKKLGVDIGDRISINYVSSDDDCFPVISKSDIFGDDSAGNKLNKSLTSSFKGRQSEMLAQYGKSFELIKDENLTDGVFKLVDPDFKGLETIKEDELIKVDKNEEVKFSSEKIELSNNNLEMSSDYINFDFNF